ncbi:MAG: (Fe-S)-binding protein [Proteobacteria bacterium]|nr:(Fe-S)-binding protein [Pseudomonadota bacterium]MBU1058568.1 (Fe-S)-binding protein [Pseudomonadota bacterium]
MAQEKYLPPIARIAEDCVNCGICVQECAFLEEKGSPKHLAEEWLAGRGGGFPFECNLCGLCRGVCPDDLDPSAMILAMRRELVARGEGDLRQHRTLRAYEKRGTSSLFSWFYLPENCKTIFFPGCALPGSRPHVFTSLFQLLQELLPDLGLVFDCCTNPSHDLGNEAHFKKTFGELCDILLRHSVQKVLVACPSCYRLFEEHGAGLRVGMIYEELGQAGRIFRQERRQVTVHDPCGVRFSGKVQDSVREILRQSGLEVREMAHSRATSFCCGEGGAAGFLRPDFSRVWTDKRVAEASAMQVVSYCAGCTSSRDRRAGSAHLLELLLNPESALEGGAKVSKAPFTYWNRYRLKKRLQRQLQGGVCGSRQELSGKKVS